MKKLSEMIKEKTFVVIDIETSGLVFSFWRKIVPFLSYKIVYNVSIREREL